MTDPVYVITTIGDSPESAGATARPEQSRRRKSPRQLASALVLSVLAITAVGNVITTSPDAPEPVAAAAEAATQQIDCAGLVGNARNYGDDGVKLSGTAACVPSHLIKAVQVSLEIWRMEKKPKRGEIARINSVSAVYIGTGKSSAKSVATGDIEVEGEYYYGVMKVRAIVTSAARKRGVRDFNKTYTSPQAWKLFLMD